jgi:IS5 family transposase
MRETRNAQSSIFDFYCEHELGKQLGELSDVLDQHPGILLLMEQDFDSTQLAQTGAYGLSLESIFRCLLLKQMLKVSYRKLGIDKLRIDSTVVKSNILDPIDSQLLDDGVRVLTRLMFQCKQRPSIKLRFVDQRKR